MTLKELLLEAEETLRASGADYPLDDARLLLEGALLIPEKELKDHINEEIDHEKKELVLSYVKRRAEGEPLQYITGYWEFFSRRFFVGKGVLIPRDDTEVVLRASIDFLRKSGKESPSVLDICSGSGILSITLKKLFPKQGCLLSRFQRTLFSISKRTQSTTRRI